MIPIQMCSSPFILSFIPLFEVSLQDFVNKEAEECDTLEEALADHEENIITLLKPAHGVNLA